MWKLLEESKKLVASRISEFKKEKLLVALDERNKELWSCAYNLLQDVERVGLEIARLQLDSYLEKKNSHIKCALDYFVSASAEKRAKAMRPCKTEVISF